MRRTHVILACGILVVGIGLGAYLIQSHKYIREKYDKTDSTTQEPQPKSCPTIVILNRELSAQNTASKQEATSDDVAYKIYVAPQPSDWWFRSSVIIAGIVALGGIIALLFVREQIKDLVNSERAWIDGNLIWHRSLDFDLNLVNHGKTAAHLQTYWIEIGLLDKEGEYDFPYITSNNIDTLRGSGELEHIPEIKLAMFFAGKKVSGREGVFIRVRIKYWDIVTITDRKPKPRWTTFICVYNRKTNEITRLRHETKYE